ncbi:MAG: hypothetical protein AAFP84_18260 [Actinomycetota bacterium]
MNVTAIDASEPTFLVVWANGAPQPNASNLDPVPGQPPTPNAVTSEVNSLGELAIFNLAGTVDVLADVNGYYLDHDHDDQYLGFGGSLMEAALSGGATVSGSSIRLPDSGTPSMELAFGLPPGREPGRLVEVQIPFTAPENCQVEFSMSGVLAPFADSERLLNTSWRVDGTIDDVVQFGPAPPGGGGQTVVIVTFVNPFSRDIPAGGSVELELTRTNSPADTCSGSVQARGGYSVGY